jgi:hypothetical protein
VEREREREREREKEREREDNGGRDWRGGWMQWNWGWRALEGGGERVVRELRA